MKATEIYAQTGEVIERDFTKAELVQREKDQQEYAAAEAAKQDEEKAKTTAKAALLSKLGITAEEARLLLS